MHKTTKHIPKTYTIPFALIKRLEAFAELEERTKSYVIKKALELYLDKKDREFDDDWTPQELIEIEESLNFDSKSCSSIEDFEASL